MQITAIKGIKTLFERSYVICKAMSSSSKVLTGVINISDKAIIIANVNPHMINQEFIDETLLLTQDELFIFREFSFWALNSKLVKKENIHFTIKVYPYKVEFMAWYTEFSAEEVLPSLSFTNDTNGKYNSLFYDSVTSTNIYETFSSHSKIAVFRFDLEGRFAL